MVDQTLDEVRHVQEINRGKRFEELKRNYKKQIENHINDVVDAGCWTVYLVDNDQSLESLLECFVQDETSLRLWTFHTINQKHNTVTHVQNTLNLTTEVGVAWCVPVCTCQKKSSDTKNRTEFANLHDVDLNSISCHGQVF